MIRFAPFLLAALLLAVGTARDGIDAWVDATVLPPLMPETSVEVRDRAGDLLRVYTVDDGRWRLAVPPGAVDSRFARMLIAFEDKRFATHSGVDSIALLRAAGQMLRHGRVVSGGSTLTMQVARLLEDSGTGRWRGKLRQMRLALALERRFSKDQILQLYLLRAPYGGNVEGIRAASLTWFGKEPRRLTLAEAALLIALPQAPAARRPDRHPAAARIARARVLGRLGTAGILSEEDVAAALTESVPLRRRAMPASAQHLTDRARTDAPETTRHDLTIDGALQRGLEDLAVDALRGKGRRLSIAMMVADHQTGEVLASVGSAGFDANGGRQGYVDMTRALRSPGSTLKPLVYALAFDQGLAHPQTLIDDRPVAFGRYAPQNFDGRFRGELRVAEALRQSLNIPVVALTDALGPAKLVAALRRAGVEPVIPGGKPGLAVALGGVGVTMQDLVTLYAGLARGGEAVQLLYRADGRFDGRPDDRPAERPAARTSWIVAPRAAWQAGHILAGLAPPPGAGRMRLAYKTGTSYGHRDAWAIGFDGQHVAAVWIGRADGTPVPGAFGGDLAAPVLFQVFGRIAPVAVPLPPPPPDALLAQGPASLPPPLRRFAARRGVSKAVDPDAPIVAFPPSGAVLRTEAGALPVKLRGGSAPYTWLVDGAPVAVQRSGAQADLPIGGVGYTVITVIDAFGRADRVTVKIE